MRLVLVQNLLGSDGHHAEQPVFLVVDIIKQLPTVVPLNTVISDIFTLLILNLCSPNASISETKIQYLFGAAYEYKIWGMVLNKRRILDLCQYNLSLTYDAAIIREQMGLLTL